MIKIHYKKMGLVLVAAGVLAATGAMAEDATMAPNRAQRIQDRQEVRQEAGTQNACERLSQFSDDLGKQASDAENNIRIRQEERMSNWDDKENLADEKMAKLRSRWEANRQEQFNKLEEAAKTDEQKEAVKNFEETVRAAIETRQAAVDAAVEAFRSGVKAAIETRKGQLDSIVSDSVSARKSALEKAKEDCDAGKDAAMVRNNFRSAMKASRTQMQSDRQNVTKVSATVQSLIQTRHAAVEKAMSEFKATMEQARLNLKEAFSDTQDADAEKNASAS